MLQTGDPLGAPHACPHPSFLSAGMVLCMHAKHAEVAMGCPFRPTTAGRRGSFSLYSQHNVILR